MFVVDLCAIEWCEKGKLAVGPQPFLTVASQSIRNIRPQLKLKLKKDLLYIYGQSIKDSGLPAEPKLLQIFLDALLSPSPGEDIEILLKYRGLCRSLVVQSGRERVCEMAKTRPITVSDLFQLLQSSSIATQVQAACVSTLVEILECEDRFS